MTTRILVQIPKLGRTQLSDWIVRTEQAKHHSQLVELKQEHENLTTQYKDLQNTYRAASLPERELAEENQRLKQKLQLITERLNALRRRTARCKTEPVKRLTRRWKRTAGKGSWFISLSIVLPPAVAHPTFAD